MLCKVPSSNSNIWNITSDGALEIRELRKRLIQLAEYMDNEWKKLLGASVEYGEGLGIYQDSLQETLEHLELTNAKAKEGVEVLHARLQEYENAILKECNASWLIETDKDSK